MNETWQDMGRSAPGDDPVALGATGGVPAALAPTHVIMSNVRLHGSPAAIDHVVIGPTGVWVIDIVSPPGTYSAADGTLWCDGEPVRRAQEIIEWKAGLVAAVTGADPLPVLAFTRATLPRPAQMIGRTRCLEARALRDYVSDAAVVLGDYDIGRIETLLHGALVPNAAPPVPVVTDPLTDPAPTADSEAGSRLLLVGAALAALSGIALLIASVVVATTSDPLRVPRPRPATVAEAPAIGSVPVTFECLAPFGWAARLGWPGDADDVAGYDVRAEGNGLTVMERRWETPLDPGDPIVGLQPGMTLTVTNESRPGPGGVPATAVTTVVVPTEPC